MDCALSNFEGLHLYTGHLCTLTVNVYLSQRSDINLAMKPWYGVSCGGVKIIGNQIFQVWQVESISFVQVKKNLDHVYINLIFLLLQKYLQYKLIDVDNYTDCKVLMCASACKGVCLRSIQCTKTTATRKKSCYGFLSYHSQILQNSFAWNS